MAKRRVLSGFGTRRDILVDLPDGQAAIDCGLLHETLPDGGCPA